MSENEKKERPKAKGKRKTTSRTTTRTRDAAQGGGIDLSSLGIGISLDDLERPRTATEILEDARKRAKINAGTNLEVDDPTGETAATDTADQTTRLSDDEPSADKTPSSTADLQPLFPSTEETEGLSGDDDDIDPFADEEDEPASSMSTGAISMESAARVDTSGAHQRIADRANAGHGLQAANRARAHLRRLMVACAVALVTLIVVGIIAFVSLSSRSKAPEEPKAVEASTASETSSQQEESSAKKEDADETLMPDQIMQLLPSLTYDGTSVGTEAHRAAITVRSGNVMVVETSEAEGEDLLTNCAYKADALALALKNKTVKGTSDTSGAKTTSVTWVACDQEGTIQAAVQYTPSSAVSAGSLSDVLTSANGYVISDSLYESVSTLGFSQTEGRTPSTPNGKIITAGVTMQEVESGTSSSSSSSDDSSYDGYYYDNTYVYYYSDDSSSSDTSEDSGSEDSGSESSGTEGSGTEDSGTTDTGSSDDTSSDGGETSGDTGADSGETSGDSGTDDAGTSDSGTEE